MVKDINVRETTVGPKHDPYSRQFIEVRLQSGTKVTFVSCGLGGYGFMFGLDDKTIVWDWRAGEGNARRLFLLHTGREPEDVLDEFYEDYEEDPMGPLSWYV